jgi:hypothetical protein
LIGDADPLVELDQIRAETKKHMLAIVHNFAGARMLPRRGSAAQKRPLLKQGYTETRIG